MAAVVRVALLLAALWMTEAEYISMPGYGDFELVKKAVTWFEARAACNKDNAHLAIMKSEEEFKTLLAAFKVNISASGNEVFSGFHSLFEETEWITIFDEPLITSGFSDWAYGNPEEGQRCGGVCTNPDGLCSQNCTTSLYYICKKKSSS